MCTLQLIERKEESSLTIQCWLCKLTNDLYIVTCFKSSLALITRSTHHQQLILWTQLSNDLTRRAGLRSKRNTRRRAINSLKVFRVYSLSLSSILKWSLIGCDWFHAMRCAADIWPFCRQTIFLFTSMRTMLQVSEKYPPKRKFFFCFFIDSVSQFSMKLMNNREIDLHVLFDANNIVDLNCEKKNL